MNRIKELREERRLSQRELGEMIGVSYQAIFNWENGFHSPSASQICQLAECLEVSTDYLLGRKMDWKYYRSVFRGLSLASDNEVLKMVEEYLEEMKPEE